MAAAPTFTYHWMHLPSGKRGTRTIVRGEFSDAQTDAQRIYSEKDLLVALNRWNRSSPGTWQYWTD